MQHHLSEKEDGKEFEAICNLPYCPTSSKGNRSRIFDWPWCSWTCEVLGENDTVMIPKAVRSLGVGNDKRQGQGQWTSEGGSYLAKFPRKLRIHTGPNKWLKCYPSGPRLQSRLRCPEEITESMDKHWALDTGQAFWVNEHIQFPSVLEEPSNGLWDRKILKCVWS